MRTPAAGTLLAHDVCVDTTSDGLPPLGVRRGAAGLLLVAAATQLLGQAWLRLSGATPAPAGDGSAASSTWVASHVVLVVSAVALVGAVALLAVVVGPGPGTRVGVAVFAVGQAMSLGVLGLDLLGGPDDARVVRVLDRWDFLAVVGAVVLLLELRRRRPALGTGANLALLGLAVPALDGLVVAAAALVLAGSAALSHDLLRPRAEPAPTWLSLLVAVACVAAGTLSWQRALIAVVVLGWTAHLLRTTAGRTSSADARRTPPGSRRSPARRP